MPEGTAAKHFGNGPRVGDGDAEWGSLAGCLPPEATEGLVDAATDRGGRRDTFMGDHQMSTYILTFLASFVGMALVCRYIQQKGWRV